MWVTNVRRRPLPTGPGEDPPPIAVPAVSDLRRITAAGLAIGGEDERQRALRAGNFDAQSVSDAQSTLDAQPPSLTTAEEGGESVTASLGGFSHAGSASRAAADEREAQSRRLRLQSRHCFAQLDCASSCACLPDGNVVVANTGAHRLLHIAPDSGEVLGSLGGFRGPRGVVADAQHLYVADCYNCVVKKFVLADGRLVGTCGAYGSGDGQLRYPHGLALCREGSSHEGTLFVADSSNGRVVAFDTNSLAYVRAFSLQARGARPGGLAILADELFVTDAYHRRLQVPTPSP
jgi:hypothetical protein